jgi:8-oxo-dGTP pyrophosphatase MutT (NUDIX family)
MRTFYAGGFFYNQKTQEVLLHKRDNNTNVNPNKWSFFGGTSEADETPLQTFVREIYEELSVTLSEDEIIPLCDYENVERGTHRYVFYVISDKKKESMVLGEGADFDWIPLSKVFEYDLTKKTVDDLSIFLKIL